MKAKKTQRKPISHFAYQPPNSDETYEKSVKQSHAVDFLSQNDDSYLPTMNRLVRWFLHRSLSYPSNLKLQNATISISDLVSSPLPVYSSFFSTFSPNLPHMHTDDSI